MRVLHFTENFSQPSETFIKKYVEKSCQFADVAVAAFSIYNVPVEIEKKITLYKIDNPAFSRKNIAGIKRFAFEKTTSKAIWHQQFSQILDNFKPDVIHCHFGPAGVMLMQFDSKHKNNIPCVTSFYGYDISSLPLTNKKYNSALKKLWLKASGFFAEGPALRKKIIALNCPPDKCFINPLLIPANDYPIKKIYRQVNEPVKFLFAGRFVEKKGFQLFLEAIAKFKGISDFTIDVFGSGPMEPIYKEIANTCKLSKFVKWHDFTGHNEIISKLKDYDFLVHPSLTATDQDSEGGAPTIIIEAQAAGLPVITTDHADIPFVMGYHDFMAKENDEASLISVIEKIVSCNDIEYYAQLGIAKVREQHDLVSNKSYEANLRLIINSECPV